MFNHCGILYKFSAHRHRNGVQMFPTTAGADAAISTEPGAEAYQRSEGAGQGPGAVLQVIYEHIQGQRAT